MDRRMMPIFRRLSSGPGTAFIVGSVSVILVLSANVHAADDQAYEALRQWIDAAPVTVDITPGQHLTAAEREVLESVIPPSAWN